MDSARRVVFLGFSFERRNMDLPSSPIRTTKGVIASGYGIHSPELDVLTTRIRRLFQQSTEGAPSIQIDLGSKCFQLLTEHWATFT
jgi:hypothetical protein